MSPDSPEYPLWSLLLLTLILYRLRYPSKKPYSPEHRLIKPQTLALSPSLLGPTRGLQGRNTITPLSSEKKIQILQIKAALAFFKGSEFLELEGLGSNWHVSIEVQSLSGF